MAQSFGDADANGALVGQVEKDSPAAKAGFKSGDVIRKIDGVAVVDSTDVTSRIGNTAPGTTLNVEVWRGGTAIELSTRIGTLDDAKLTKADDEEARPKASSASPCVPAVPMSRRPGGKAGLVVEKASGAAAKAGVQPGDVIVGVGASAVSSVEELRVGCRQGGQDHRAADRARGAANLRAGEAVLILRFDAPARFADDRAGAAFLEFPQQLPAGTGSSSTALTVACSSTPRRSSTRGGDRPIRQETAWAAARSSGRC